MNKGWIHKNKKSKRKKEKGFDRNQPIIPPLVEDCISFLEQEGKCNILYIKIFFKRFIM